MKRVNWPARVAKRKVARASLQLALGEIESLSERGGPRTWNTDAYKVAMHLARHAAEQLRLSEE